MSRDEAQRKASFPQGLDLIDKAEGTGPGEIAPEILRVEADDLLLAADQVSGKINLDFELKAAIEGAQFGEAAAVLDPHRLENLER